MKHLHINEFKLLNKIQILPKYNESNCHNDIKKFYQKDKTKIAFQISRVI